MEKIKEGALLADKSLSVYCARSPFNKISLPGKHCEYKAAVWKDHVSFSVQEMLGHPLIF